MARCVMRRVYGPKAGPAAHHEEAAERAARTKARGLRLPSGRVLDRREPTRWTRCRIRAFREVWNAEQARAFVDFTADRDLGRLYRAARCDLAFDHGVAGGDADIHSAGAIVYCVVNE